MVPLKPFSFVIPNRFSGEESAVGLRFSALTEIAIFVQRAETECPQNA